MADREKPRAEGIALIAFAHGKGFLLAWQADEVLEDYVGENGARGESFSLDYACIDYAPQPDGAHIAKLAFVDDGPSDWGRGAREVMVSCVEMRPATAEEWQHHLDGEWPWDFTPQVSPDRVVLERHFCETPSTAVCGVDLRGDGDFAAFYDSTTNAFAAVTCLECRTWLRENRLACGGFADPAEWSRDEGR